MKHFIFQLFSLVYGLEVPSVPIDVQRKVSKSTAQLDVDETVKQDADRICKEFYAEKSVTSDSVTISMVAQGGQGYIFKCETSNQDVDPQVTALKYYYTVDDKNMTELELINTATNEAGVRPTLYKWHERGYIEQWLGDYADLWSPTAPMNMYQLRFRAGAELAKMHSIDVSTINKRKYTEFTHWMWNTRNINFHFLLNLEIFIPAENMQNSLDFLGWNYADYRNNKDWTEQLVHNYYQDNEDSVVFCHNDPHGGNMMLRKNDTVGDSYTLIDFDNAAYGYRAWDFAYYFGYMSLFLPNGGYPHGQDVDDFFNEYLLHYTGPDAESLTLSKLKEELDIHLPYVLLEQFIFQDAMAGSTLMRQASYICKYMDLQKQFDYPKPIDCAALLSVASHATLSLVVIGLISLF